MKSTIITNTSPETGTGYFRKTAFVAGVFYVLTFVSIPTLSLYPHMDDLDFILGRGSDTPVILGGLLEIIVGLACMASAVVLYPVLKIQNEAAALGLVAARVLEATLIFAGVACMLAVVTLRQDGAGMESLSTGHTLVILYNRIFSISQNLMPAVDDLILGVLLYQSRLVPRFLAVIGVAGSFTLLGGAIAVLFGVIELRSLPMGLAAIGVASFEFTLGIWLMVKGFNRTNKITGNSIL